MTGTSARDDHRQIEVVVRCYAGLNDFLRPERQRVAFQAVCASRTTVKDLLEGLGVPHTEVDLILVNGEPVGFDERPADGDRISAYPPFFSLDISTVTRVRPSPLAEMRFVLDGHLGRLAAFLRLAGFDTLYFGNAEDAFLAQCAADETRVLLTRDQGLLKRGLVAHGYWVRRTAPVGQLAEVVERYQLLEQARPFTRCMRCNGRLEAVTKAEVSEVVPPRSLERHEEFLRCEACRRVYWRGTHYDRLVALLAELK